MEREDDEAVLVPLRMHLMACIGTALLNVQVTERALRLVTTVVLQKSSPITTEQLIAQTNVEQKKTLGYFLRELRKRVDLDVHFDRTLAEFLRRRNILAHNLSDLPGWNTDTVHGIYIGRYFINELIQMNTEVLKVFTALVRAWQAQAGLAILDDVSEGFEEIDKKYVPLIDDLFAKDPEMQAQRLERAFRAPPPIAIPEEPV
jgi:hypothetical protein